MIGFVIIWNLLCILSFRLDGSVSRPFHSYAAALVMSLDFLLVALSGFGTLMFHSIRSIVLRPEADVLRARTGLRFIGILGTLGALTPLFSVHA